MTDEELKAIEARIERRETLWPNESLPLVAEVRRLRGLIKAAEWQPSCCFDAFCAWCGDSQSYDQKKRGHADDCPAFTPDGSVR